MAGSASGRSRLRASGRGFLAARAPQPAPGLGRTRPGPAEFLSTTARGGRRRKNRRRLGTGDEIPGSALTGPEAGSDAAATQSEGIVEKRAIDGVEVIGLRFNWKKRYITLAPVATLIGLAFRLKDPDHILGAEEDRGITCALIPR